MTDDRATALFFELFDNLPRQGPGDAASTRRALALVPELRPSSRVLDIGCGTGAQTFVLAEHAPAQIVAIDNHPPFVDAVRRRARARGLAGRIDARVGDMQALDPELGPVDLIWSEGAIYLAGFEHGLRAWRPLLVPGGHVAVTEVCWMRPDPPEACVRFWNDEYPAIRDVQTMLDRIPACGYELVGHFALPPSSWWDDYYAPLGRNVTAFRARHGEDADARALADQVEREIDAWHRYAAFYSYEFFVMRAQ